MQATIFLVSTLFDLYLMVAILRVWMQLSRADFYNPVSQFVVKATNPFVVPFRRVIPGFGGVDWAGVLLVLLVSFAKYSVLQLMFSQGFPTQAILIQSLIGAIDELFTLMFWVMLIRVIFSFISQGYNPLEALLHQMTEPMLAPIRKIIPPMGGFDWSVLVFVIALQFVQILFQDLLRSIF